MLKLKPTLCALLAGYSAITFFSLNAGNPGFFAEIFGIEQSSSALPQQAAPLQVVSTAILASTDELLARLAQDLNGKVTVRPTDAGGKRHMWQSETAANNYVQIWDDDGNGTVDLIQMGLGLPTSGGEADLPRWIESIATAHMIIESAGHQSVVGSTVKDWALESAKAASGTTMHRRFGTLEVRLTPARAEGGVFLLVGIGEEG